jgi:hypothetical protein
MIKMETVSISTNGGRILDNKRIFLMTKEETEEFNLIGYSGKNSSGKKASRIEYLNSLGKGVFCIIQTKWGFIESFIIVRAFESQ